MTTYYEILLEAINGAEQLNEAKVQIIKAKSAMLVSNESNNYYTLAQEGVIDSVKNFLKKVWEFLSNFISKVASYIKDLFLKLLSKAKKFFLSKKKKRNAKESADILSLESDGEKVYAIDYRPVIEVGEKLAHDVDTYKGFIEDICKDLYSVAAEIEKNRANASEILENHLKKFDNTPIEHVKTQVKATLDRSIEAMRIVYIPEDEFYKLSEGYIDKLQNSTMYKVVRICDQAQRDLTSGRSRTFNDIAEKFPELVAPYAERYKKAVSNQLKMIGAFCRYIVYITSNLYWRTWNNEEEAKEEIKNLRDNALDSVN